MSVDHFTMYLFPEVVDAQWLRVIGRGAAPIFCFLVGWNGSYRFRRTLLVAAVIATCCDTLYHGVTTLNVLWSILLGRMLLDWLERRAKLEQSIVMVFAAIVWALPSMLLTEYGGLALLWMLWGRAQRRAPEGKDCRVFAVAAFVVALVMTLSTFPFNGAQQLGSIGVLLVVTLWLQRFTLVTYESVKRPLLSFWSHHAMPYYVLHRAVLIGLALALHIKPAS
jgi:hypothetical protein